MADSIVTLQTDNSPAAQLERFVAQLTDNNSRAIMQLLAAMQFGFKGVWQPTGGNTPSTVIARLNSGQIASQLFKVSALTVTFLAQLLPLINDPNVTAQLAPILAQFQIPSGYTVTDNGDGKTVTLALAAPAQGS